MTSDPFLRASATYINAQRTNQARERGWNFDAAVDRSPLWIRVVEVMFRPSTVFSLALLGLCVFLLVNF